MTFLLSLSHPRFSLFLLLSAWSSPSNGVEGCTVFLVGRDATIDGSVLVSHSNDGEFETDPRLVKIPAADYDEDAARPVFFSPESYPRYVGTERGDIPAYAPSNNNHTSFVPLGHIPQVSHTYAYLEETYAAVNEHQVGIGESTCSGVFGAVPLGAPNGTALWSVDELTRVALERSVTAREAILLMGRLAEEQGGFYGAGMFEGTAESLAVSDANEAWIFHILPDPTGTSAIWAAQRIPDDGIAVLANMFVLRDLYPEDSEHYLVSASTYMVAQEYGWWHPDDGIPLDFTKLYSDGEYAHKYYSGRRIWGAYRLACPSGEYPADYVDLQADPVYPLSCTPDKKLSTTDLFAYHRDTYQGTPFDLGAAGNMAGGPFGTPDRWKAGPAEAVHPGNWERPIGLYRTSDTYVVQSRADATDAILWFGPASALATVFTPFIVDAPAVPPSFANGHQAKWDRTSAFWAACVTHNVANLKWSYAIRTVRTKQREWEAASVALVEEVEGIFRRTGNQTVRHQVYWDNAVATVEALWALSDELLFTFASGFVNEPPDGMSQMVGYPSWWLDAVGYADGPPPPPTKPKCCLPPPSPHSVSTIRNRSTDASMVTSSKMLTGKAAMKAHIAAARE